MTHGGNKPSVCDVCMKAFTQSSSLKTHKKTIHTPQAPFACDMCSAAFNWAGDMEKHKRVHTCPKPPDGGVEETFKM